MLPVRCSPLPTAALVQCVRGLDPRPACACPGIRRVPASFDSIVLSPVVPVAAV